MIIESKNIINLLGDEELIPSGYYHKKELLQEILITYSIKEISYYLGIDKDDLLLDHDEIIEKYLPMIKEDWIQI